VQKLRDTKARTTFTLLSRDHGEFTGSHCYSFCRTTQHLVFSSLHCEQEFQVSREHEGAARFLRIQDWPSPCVRIRSPFMGKKGELQNRDFRQGCQCTYITREVQKESRDFCCPPTQPYLRPNEKAAHPLDPLRGTQGCLGLCTGKHYLPFHACTLSSPSLPSLSLILQSPDQMPLPLLSFHISSLIRPYFTVPMQPPPNAF
jgi:hypothetical protein